MNRIYMCIDLKSFYASVECVERGLNPLDTNLVVADPSRTEKTICLAVTPSLKAFGIPGRARLFEVVAKVKEINRERKKKIYGGFSGKSFLSSEINKNNKLEIDYIVVPPRMKLYKKYSTDIYDTYLKFLAPEDIYVYSIDEVFCDITNYLLLYKLTPKELVTKMIKAVYDRTGITATAGIGSNLYLAKIAMDIVAKHMPANEFGVRLAELDEMSYRKELWNHKPLTSFWRTGPGISKRLIQNGMNTMGDVARMSLTNEALLYKLFGVNAELIIDHAWGYEPVTLSDIRAFIPERNSISTGQVLHCPYDYKKTKLVVSEMIDLLALDLTSKNLVTDEIILVIGYDINNLTNSTIEYDGEVVLDHYGRQIPKSSHGNIRLDFYTDSQTYLREKCLELFERIINKNLFVRRINVVANNVVNETKMNNQVIRKQLNLFDEEIIIDKEKLNKDSKIQKTIVNIKNKYGKNAILKGMNLEEGATAVSRNKQVGGHSE